jgi:hypothetical protein
VFSGIKSIISSAWRYTFGVYKFGFYSGVIAVVLLYAIFYAMLNGDNVQPQQSTSTYVPPKVQPYQPPVPSPAPVVRAPLPPPVPPPTSLHFAGGPYEGLIVSRISKARLRCFADSFLTYTVTITDSPPIGYDVWVYLDESVKRIRIQLRRNHNGTEKEVQYNDCLRLHQ